MSKSTVMVTFVCMASITVTVMVMCMVMVKVSKRRTGQAKLTEQGG